MDYSGYDFWKILYIQRFAWIDSGYMYIRQFMEAFFGIVEFFHVPVDFGS